MTGITRVQGNARGYSASNSITVNMASTPTNGNLLIATVVCKYSSAVQTNSITQTNVTWTLQKRQQEATWHFNVEIWAGVVGAGAGTQAVFALSSTTAGYGAVANICEYSNLLTDGFLDKTAGDSSASSESKNTGTTDETTQVRELIIGCIGAVADLSGTSPTNGFTKLDGDRYTNVSNLYLEKIVAETDVQSSTVTSSNGDYAGAIATFKGKPFTVTISAQTGGSCNPTGEQSYTHLSIGVIATAGEGYDFTGWLLDGTPVSVWSPYSLEGDAGDSFTLTAMFNHEVTDTRLSSYSITNFSGDAVLLNCVYPIEGTWIVGQVFKTPEIFYYKLKQARFFLAKYGSPTGNLQAQIYAVTGTYGSTAKPTGDVLAESAAVDSSTLTERQLVEFTFSGDNQIILEPDTAYAIGVAATTDTISGGDVVYFFTDNTAPTHAGNAFYIDEGFFGALPYADSLFYVYGEAYKGLTIIAGENGLTYPAAGTTEYEVETDVIVYARPNRGYILSGWLVNDEEITSKSSRLTVTVDNYYTLQPVFALAYTATDASLKLFNNIKLSVRKQTNVENFNVTLHALSLGAQDSDTGIPAKTYSDSTIEMLITSKSNTALNTVLGAYVKLDALGFTTSYVRAWDKITTTTGKQFFVANVTPILNGVYLAYYQVDLMEIVLT